MIGKVLLLCKQRCLDKLGVCLPKELCRGLETRHDFLILHRNSLFTITVSDSKVSLLLMDLLLSHSTLQLPGETPGREELGFQRSPQPHVPAGLQRGFPN